MEEDERREAAIAAASALIPNHKNRGVTEDQLKKLKELREKRLQIKARSKIRKISKVSSSGTPNSQGKELRGKEEKYDHEFVALEGSAILGAKQDEAKPSSSLKKRQKLHWGLDTKERWERKANM